MRRRFVLLFLCVFVAPLSILTAEALVQAAQSTNIFSTPVNSCAVAANDGGGAAATNAIANRTAVCTVGSGLYGLNCETCACKNGSTCNDGNLGDGSCTCATNFTGPFCEIPCRCQNGGRCRNETLDLSYDYPFLYRQPCDCNATQSYGPFCDIRCDCNTTNTVRNSSECDYRGRCRCAGNFAGHQCNECKPGFWGIYCDEICDCAPLGSLTRACNKTTGQCFCNANVTGVKCERCVAEGMSGLNCDIPCNCTGNNVINNTNSCDVSGQCACQSGFWGKRCAEPCSCIGYNNTDLQNGTNSFVNTSAICDIATGQCPCNPGFYGRDCALICSCNASNTDPAGCDNAFGQCRCKQGWWGSVCNQTCDCLATNATNVALNNTCNAITGGCVCKPGWYGVDCNTPCECSKDGSLTADCDASGQCFCQLGVTGLKCDSCAPQVVELLAEFCEPPPACTNSTGNNTNVNTTSWWFNSGPVNDADEIKGLELDKLQL